VALVLDWFRQYWALLSEERDELDVAKEAELTRHMTSMREEMIDKIKRLRQELEQEHNQTSSHQLQIMRLRDV